MMYLVLAGMAFVLKLLVVLVVYLCMRYKFKIWG